MNKITLVILAAGMGSRFGNRIKQLEPIGPNGELLIDYSISDAIKAGFDRVVFIIRKDIEELFKETIGNRISKLIKTEYVFQEKNDLPLKAESFTNRTKPWGTAQALYCCRNILDSNFGVINADDYYGEQAFLALADFLRKGTTSACSVNFVLKNTLSDNGTVNRGVCHVNEKGLLVNVEETKNISRNNEGVIIGIRNGREIILNENDLVSMSMWGFTPPFIERLSTVLEKFISSLESDDITTEITIADAVDAEIKQNGYNVKNIVTDSKWFGITYEADVEHTRTALRSVIIRSEKNNDE